jgi:hypothetical protein
MAYDDREMKMRKGQAYNLAVSTAIAEGKHNDNEYIVKQFLRHLQFASLLQKATPEQLTEVTKTESMIALMKQLDEEVK